MSEGLCFYSTHQNITLYLPGHVIRFKNGRFPAEVKKFATEAEAEAIRAHASYGGSVESNEDREKRLAPDPKAEAALVEAALKRLASIPGVVPSEPNPSSPQSDVPQRSQKQDMEEPAQAPSLTAVSRMKKADLLKTAKELGVEVTEGETVGILKRRIRSWIKQHTA